MKKTAFSSLLRRTAALALAAVLLVPTVYADAGTKKLKTDHQLTPGLSYHNTITENHSRRVESFSMELEPGSAVKPILLQASGTIYGAATINKAVQNAQNMGYQVLGAINTDFFATSTGVPLGIVVENGVYKSSHATSASEYAMTVTDGKVALCENPKVDLTLTNMATGQAVTPNNFNKMRSEYGGVYLLNQDFSTVSTRTKTPGWYVRMKLDDPNAKLTVNSTLTMTVTEVLHSDQPLVIAPDEYILTSDDLSKREDVFQSYHVGDRVFLQTYAADPGLSAAQWAGGVGDLMVKDGALTDSSKWTYVNSGRAPRTALGVKSDGTLLLYAVDGRQSSHSAGLSQMDLAQELQNQGCQWAVNLDGGGSTVLSVWIPGQSGPSIISRPSDGKARGCATYLLLVSDQKGSGVPARLACADSGLAVLAGSSVSLPAVQVLDDGLTPLKTTANDLIYTSLNGLGAIENGVYKAWGTPGTDVIRVHSPSLGVEGTFQIHVVDGLTAFDVYKSGSSTPLTSINGKPGEAIQLTAQGSYWNRPALRSGAGVTWTVHGNIGTIDANGRFTPSGGAAKGSITATAGGMVKEIPFSTVNTHVDVPKGHWAYNAVEYCYTHHIVSGISPTQFGPDLNVQRADFIVMLYNAVGRPKPTNSCTFTDVNPSDYYYKPLAWAQANGLAAGAGDGRFLPHSVITREQAFTILYHALPVLGKESPKAPLTYLDAFRDKDQISGYAKTPTATLVAQKMVGGSDGKIMPQQPMNRAACAAVLRNVMERKPGPLPPAPVDPNVKLDISPVALELKSTDSAAITLTGAPADAQIVWTSSAPATVAVAPNGVVTNLYAGVGSDTATITASVAGHSASCTVVCLPPELVGQVHDAQAGLNVRSGPGREHGKVGSLPNDARVVVLEQADGWYHIFFLNEQNQAAHGYVSAEYLNLVP